MSQVSTEENPPIAFLGLIEDCDGVDIKQFKDSIPMSSKGHIKQMLKTHDWDEEHLIVPNTAKMVNQSHPVSQPADCLT